MKNKPKYSRAASSDSANKLKGIHDALAELRDKIPEAFEDEIPAFCFKTDSKKAEIQLMSASLEVSHNVDFWDEVDNIGADNQGWYSPSAMERWIKHFREAADRLERNLAECRSKPDEFRSSDE